MKSDIILYTTEDGQTVVTVKFDQDTVWLPQKQIAELFDKGRSTITEHISNVYAEGEVDKEPTCRKIRQVQIEGKRKIEREVEHYNLDVIISVGYRVKSKRGTQFRIWATKILKEHLVQGFSVNQKRLKELQKSVQLLGRTVNEQRIELDETKALVKVISDFSYGLSILDDYDHQTVEISNVSEGECYQLSYETARKLIVTMINSFESDVFGIEKDGSFKGAIGNIYQTFDGIDLYPSIEEKAANLLYFIVKDHAFSDGNKRIAAAIFLYFLERNGLLYNTDSSKRIADNALAAITLMIAESKPQEKAIIVKIVVNLINHKN